VAGYRKVSTMFSGQQNTVYRAVKDGRTFVAKAIPKSRFRLAETRIPVLARSSAVVAPVEVVQRSVRGRDVVFAFYEYDPRSVDALDFTNDRGSEALVDEVAAGMARCLAEFHELGYVHGDVKLENFLVFPDLSVKLIDFGMSRHVADKSYSPGGTRMYAAPELRGSGRTSSESDVWAFGASLYYAVTCRKPDEFPRDPVSGKVGEIIRSCAREDPRDRMTMEEIARILASKKRPRDPEETP